MTILINGKDAHELSIGELQEAAYDLARRAHHKRVMQFADELEGDIKVAWADYHAGTGRQPDVNKMIDGECDVVVYSLDIACTLLASDNSDYAYDEGLVESHDDAAAAYHALVQDVARELDTRGALGEPEPTREGSDDESNDEDEGEADTERAPSPFCGEEVEVTGADGVVRKMRAKT